jgi:hypothetical protein
MIGHAVMDVFNFGYWWWQLLGHYDRRPISETGIDLDFLVWTGTLACSLSLFWVAVRKLSTTYAKAARGLSAISPEVQPAVIPRPRI